MIQGYTGALPGWHNHSPFRPTFPASTNGTISSHRYEWYWPVPGESTNWLPPYAVQASTYTTTQGGAPPPAKSASAASDPARAIAGALRAYDGSYERF